MSFTVWCPDRGEKRSGAKVFRAWSPEEAAQAWAEDADDQHRWEEAFGREAKHSLVEESATFNEEADESEAGCLVLVARDKEEPERYRVTAETRVVSKSPAVCGGGCAMPNEETRLQNDIQEALCWLSGCVARLEQIRKLGGIALVGRSVKEVVEAVRHPRARRH